MIIFYSEETGQIIGTIEGRVHDEAQLKVGMTTTGVDPKKVGKIVCHWKIVGESEEIVEKEIVEKYVRNAEGFDEPVLKKIRQKIKRPQVEPDHPQKDIMIALDKNSLDAYKYKVDTKTKKLILK